jgi:PAS domain S-box-containing protein
VDDSDKTREALLAEIRDLRSRIEVMETENRRADASWYEATLHAWQDSEERYRRLVEYCPDGIAIHCDGRIVFANPAMAEILGTTPAGLLGKSLWEIVHPEYWNLVRERLEALIHKGEAVPRIEEKMIRADGSAVDVDVVALPFLYEGRQAAQILVRDISRNKWAEEALRESERRFRRITEAVTDYVYRVYVDQGRPVRTIHGFFVREGDGLQARGVRGGPVPVDSDGSRRGTRGRSGADSPRSGGRGARDHRASHHPQGR